MTTHLRPEKPRQQPHPPQLRPFLLRTCSWLLPILLVGCGGGAADDSPTPTAYPDYPTSTPMATPEPITVADADYTFYSYYTLKVTPVGSSEPWYLSPNGVISAASGQLSGSMTWTLYASAEDRANGVVACKYTEAVSGAVDTSVYPSVSCEDCGVYYKVSFAPPAEHTCPAAGLLALLDENGNGEVAEAELSHSDTVGFALLSTEQYPSAWASLSSWDPADEFGLKDSIECYGANYSAWSRRWHTDSSAYTPLFALYPAPFPTQCVE